MPISPLTPKPHHGMDPGSTMVTRGPESPLRDSARFHVATDSRGSCVLLPDQVKAFAVGAEEARLLAAARADPDERLQARAGGLLESLGIRITATPLEATRPALKVRPTSLVLMLTSRCNLRCAYCYERDRPSSGPADMSPATALAAVDWLFENGDRWRQLGFAFFGGEPLLNRPALEAAVDRAERRATREGRLIRFGITTNGLGLDARTVDYLAAHGFEVTVSVDGAAQRHDAQRPLAGGEGSYKIVSEGCRLLLRVLPDAMARATLLPDADPRRVRSEIEALGFRRIIVSPATPTWPESGSQAATCDNRSATCIRLSELEDEAHRIEAAVRRRDGETLRGCRDMSRILPLLELLIHGGRNVTHCGAGSFLAAADTGGDVFPCQRFMGVAAWRQGSIFTPGKWRPREMPQLWALREQCLACPARFACAGGCPHEVLAGGGDRERHHCVVQIREAELAALAHSRFDAEAAAYLIDQGVISERPCPLDLF